jgi:hypothetical protein
MYDLVPSVMIKKHVFPARVRQFHYATVICVTFLCFNFEIVFTVISS